MDNASKTSAIEKVANGLSELLHLTSQVDSKTVDKKITSVECRLSSLEKEKSKVDLSSMLQSSQVEVEKTRKSLETVSDSVELLVCKSDSHSKEIETMQEVLVSLNDQVVSLSGLMRAFATSVTTTLSGMEKANAEILKRLRKK